MFARALGTAALAFGVCAPALAVPVIYNAPVDSGAVAFDAAVASVGGTAHAQALAGLPEYVNSFDLGPFQLDTTNGSWHRVDRDYAQLGSSGHPGALTGAAVTILPTALADQSGVTFSFDQPINAFGLEIGDWGTCCFPSALYIAFDGGATRLVATATGPTDNPGYTTYGQYTNFVGAIDTSGTFSRVTFFGDGVGEYLVAGGTIRYAALPINSVSPVPEADRWAMMVAGLLGVAWFTRRRGESAE